MSPNDITDALARKLEQLERRLDNYRVRLDAHSEHLLRLETTQSQPLDKQPEEPTYASVARREGRKAGYLEGFEAGKQAAFNTDSAEKLEVLEFAVRAYDKAYLGLELGEEPALRPAMDALMRVIECNKAVIDAAKALVGT